jgi:NAD(P)H-nitrite reductase large subunit
MKPDEEICLCYGVSLRKLVNFIRREQPPVASQISQCLSAGTGCGWCVPFLRMLHREVMSGRFDAMDALASADYETMRAAWMEQDQPDRDLDQFADETLQSIPAPKASESPPAGVTDPP